MYTANKVLVKQFEEEHEFFKTQLNLGKEIFWLTEEECIKAGPNIDETLELVNRAMIYHGRKEYEMPAKIGIHPFEDVFYHAMPAYVPKNLSAGMKWIACYPRNPDEYKLPQTTGLLIMNDIMTGVPVAVMDCTWLTAMRTPAVTVLAAAKLHPDAKTFGMFGCGVQGTEHVRFIVKTLPKLEKIYIWDIIPERMDELIEAVKKDVEIPVIKAYPEDVARNSEVLSSATLCVRESINYGKAEWISKGQTILPCDLSTFWEPSLLFQADKYIVDSIDEHRLFEDMGYFPDGLPEIHCETGEMLAGHKEGRTDADELIICSNIGISTNDVSMGHLILERAFEMGLGRKLPL